MRDLHPYFGDDHPVSLDEENYKALIRDITKNNVPGEISHNLPHRDWAPLIKYVNYFGHDQGIFKFFVPNKHNGWFTYIQFDDWDDQLCDITMSAPELARLFLWSGNIKIHCPCPAFKFWGHQYIMTMRDSAIIPEIRYPHIRNPNLKGGCCKHLIRTLKVLPFHLGTMAREIKASRIDSCGVPPPPSAAD